MPTVSVVMCTHNTPEEYLRLSIESILNQTFKDFEFIIIDDGSTQNDVEIINSYKDSRIVLIKNQDNKGLPYSLNKGIKKARGKYIVRMDSDDISLTDRLQLQFDYMERYSSVGIGAGAVIRFGDKNGIGQVVPFNQNLYPFLFFKDCITHPAVIIRKDFLIKNNLLYNESFLRTQDYELWMRAIEKGTIFAMPYVVLKYRCHEKQATKKNATDQKDMSYLVVKREYEKASIICDEDFYGLHYALVNARPVEEYAQLIHFSKKLKDLSNQIVGKEYKQFSRMVGYYTEYNSIGNLIRNKYSFSWLMTKTILHPRYFMDFVEWSLVKCFIKIRLMANYAFRYKFTN